MRTGVNGVVVERLPPGKQCAGSSEELQTLELLIESIGTAQAMTRIDVRNRAREDFKTDCIVDQVINSLTLLQ